MKKTINKAYKFRVYPTDEQRIFFAKHFGCVRFIYNYLLGVRKEKYQKEGISLSGIECKRMISPLKKSKDYAWLKEVNSQSLQESALGLEKAFKRFFNKNLSSGYPAFKKKGQRDSFSVPQHFQVHEDQNFILIPKLASPIKAHFHRSLKNVTKLNSLTFSRKPSGKYFVSINVEEEIEEKKPVAKILPNTKVIGIDLGIKDFLVDSRGNKVDSPKYLRQSERKLKKAQKVLSRRLKGSINRKKQRLKVAKIHEKITNQRSNFLHQESSRIVNENQVICLETLNVKGMIRNKRLSKSISDSSWGEFIRQLKYKSEWKGSIVVQVGQWEPTSKACSTIGCTYKKEDLKLSERTWICPVCSVFHDRDINAAKNIERIGREAPELTPVKRMASVFSIKKIQVSSVKQESLAS